MTYQLIPVERGSSQPIPLQRPVLLIGRHPECDVRIDLSKISRRHCCVAIAYDRILIRDLGSHNGVRVNGQAVEEATLQAGDEVAIGPLIYRLSSDAGQPSAAPPRPNTLPPAKPEVAPTRSGRAGTPPAHPDGVDEIGLIPIDDL